LKTKGYGRTNRTSVTVLITTLKKSLPGERSPRPFSAVRMRQVRLAIQHAFDPDSPPRKA